MKRILLILTTFFLLSLGLNAQLTISWNAQGTFEYGPEDFAADGSVSWDAEKKAFICDGTGPGRIYLNLQGKTVDFSKVAHIEVKGTFKASADAEAASLGSAGDPLSNLYIQDADNGGVNGWYGSRYNVDFTGIKNGTESSYNSLASKVNTFCFNANENGVGEVYIEKVILTKIKEYDPLDVAGKFYKWSDWGKDATITAHPEFEDKIGVQVTGGATILGDGSVFGCNYADLTEYMGIEVEGTPQMQIRFLFNRPSMGGGSAACTQCYVSLDDNGKLSFIFEENLFNFEADVWDADGYPNGTKKPFHELFDYVHLNCVKAVSNGTITSMKLIPIPEKPDPYELNASWWHQWTGKTDADDAFGANVKIKEGSTTAFEDNIGMELTQGAIVLGNSTCDGDLYADIDPSEYVGIEGVATPGISVRFFFNRPTLKEGGIDTHVDTDENGNFYFDFAKLGNVDFIHLNFVKILEAYRGGKWPNGLEKAIVSSLRLVDPLEAEKKQLELAKNDLRKEIAKSKLYDEHFKTEVSLNALVAAIAAAEAAIVADDATEESIATAKEELIEAFEGLAFEEGYQNLTKEMFKTYASLENPGEGSDPGADCAYNLFELSDGPYGYGNVSELKWAELKDYDKLIITVKQGKPRLCMNRIEENGNQGATQADSKMLDINPNSWNNPQYWSTDAYNTVNDDKSIYTINLNKIVYGDGNLTGYGFARLHSIKGSDGNVLVTGMYLYKSSDPLEMPKEALSKEIEKANSCDRYLKSKESLEALDKAIDAAEKALEDKEATAESLAKAKDALTAAIDGLTLQPGYSELTKDMFKEHEAPEDISEGKEYNYHFELNGTGQPLGDWSITEKVWADLTNYDNLILTVSEGYPRICMNRKKTGGQEYDDDRQWVGNMLDMKEGNKSNELYLNHEDGSNIYTVDLRNIVDDHGYARIHAVQNCVLTGIYLYKDPKDASGYNLTFNIDDPNHVVIEVNGEEIKDLKPGANTKAVGDRAKLYIAPAEGFILKTVKADNEDVTPIKDKDHDGSLNKTVVKNISYEITTEDADPLQKPRIELTSVIENAELYDGVAKTPKSFEVLTKALKDAKPLLTESTTPEDIAKAIKAIQDAIKDLEPAKGYTDLTSDMFKKYASVTEPGDGEETDCVNETFVSSLMPYGDKQNGCLNWADLSKYDMLVITTQGTIGPRVYMNRLEDKGEQAATMEESKMIDINSKSDSWSSKYVNVENNKYIIDLTKIVKDFGFAHLHSIQPDGYEQSVLITGMYLYKLESIALAEIKELTVGEKVILTPTVTPDDSLNPAIVWSSSEEKVATVSEDGTVTAIKAGQAIITATCGKLTASCTVNCYAPLADADGDGQITVNDAVDIANYIVGKKVLSESELAFYKKAADVNNDNNISVSDASATVDLALKAKGNDSAGGPSNIAAYNDYVDMLIIGGVNVDNSVAVTLDNATPYVALQADIYVADGVNFEVKAGSRIADSHSFQYHRFDANHVRIAIYNFGGKTFADNDEALFEIVADSQLTDSGDIRLLNVLASDADAKAYRLGASYDDTTGAALVGNDTDAPVKVYDLNGRYVSDKAEGLAKGIYIIRQGDKAKKVNIR